MVRSEVEPNHVVIIDDVGVVGGGVVGGDDVGDGGGVVTIVGGFAVKSGFKFGNVVEAGNATFGVVGGVVTVALRLSLPSPSPPSLLPPIPCTTQKQNNPPLSFSVGRLSFPPIPSSPPVSPSSLSPKKLFDESGIQIETISEQRIDRP